MLRSRLVALLAAAIVQVAASLSATAALNCPLRVCADAAAIAAHSRDVAAAGKVYAADLLAADQASWLAGATADSLPPGFYRLHVPLGVAGFADRRISDLEIVLQAGPDGEFQRTVSRFDLAGDGSSEDMTLDFVLPAAARSRFALSWQVREHGKMARLKAIRAPSQPAAALGTADDGAAGGDDLRLDTDERDGLVTREHARRVPVRLVVEPPYLERRAPVGITAARADKLLYRSGEAGSLAITVTNTGPAVAGSLKVTLVQELADERVLPEMPVTLAAGETKTMTVPFEATGRWGTEARVLLSAGESRDIRREYFSVHDNFWAVGIGHVGGAAAQTGLGQHRQLPEEMRRLRANHLEIFFWAADDWCKMTPPAPEWWSGQTSYYENDANLRELISLLHKEGIKVTSYGKSTAGGPFGWEVSRQHPEWFLRTDTGAISGNYDTALLDRWNDPEFRRSLDPKKASLGWLWLYPDTRVQAVVDLGADEIARSAKHYGWDGVRFDGHYTVTGDEALSAHNMRRLLDRVRAEVPGFSFGYNFGYTPDYYGGVTDEMRQGLAGGGMYMNEGIRAWHYTNKRYTSWQHYATNELRAARAVQAAGGHYHCIYDLGGKDSDLERDYYKLVFGLVAGAHPTYGYGAEPGAGSAGWGAFMTRWSGMLWDPAAEPVVDAASLFTVEGERVWWQPFARRRVVSAQRAFYILHVLNPPPADEIAATQLAQCTSPVTVTFRPPPGTRVERAVLLSPESDPCSVAPAGKQRDGEWRATLPNALRRWAIMVWEVQGTFTPPAAPAASPPLPPLVARAATGGSAVADPLKQPVATTSPTGNVFTHAFDHGSCNLAVALSPDAEAQTGAAQYRPKSEKTIDLGSWWIGPRIPGRYRIRLRVKWTDPKDAPTPQMLRFEVHDEVDNFKEAFKTLTLVTPGYPEAPTGAQVLKDKGRYVEYEVGEYDKKFATWFTITGQATTTAVGEHTAYFDRMSFELLERYSDRQVATWGAKFLKEKPAGLRQPQGRAPQKLLLVKGMFWQPYLAQAAYRGESSYALPDSYEALYAYDSVVLCNCDFQAVPFQVRKIYQDFVQDGGRLVLLGGSFTLGQGGILQTFLDDILPVQCVGPSEIRRCEPAALLGPAKGQAYPGAPSLFWRHTATLRPEATVLAWAGAEPVAVSGVAGQGRVVVFLGTSLGVGDGQVKPFWETPAWAKLFAEMVSGP